MDAQILFLLLRNNELTWGHNQVFQKKRWRRKEKNTNAWKLDYRLRKAELDLNFYYGCKDRNFTLKFCVSSHYFKVSLTYKQCQLKLLQSRFVIRNLISEFQPKHLTLAIPHCNMKLALLAFLIWVYYFQEVAAEF